MCKRIFKHRNRSGTLPRRRRRCPPPRRGGWLEGGLALLTPAGRVLEINEPFCSWLEKPPGDLIGQSLWETLAPLATEWSQALERMGRRDTPFDRLELKLGSSAGHPAQWFLLEIVRAPECVVCPPELGAAVADRTGGSGLGRTSAQ